MTDVDSSTWVMHTNFLSLNTKSFCRNNPVSYNYSYPILKFDDTIAALGQVVNSVRIGVTIVQECADVVYVVFYC